MIDTEVAAEEKYENTKESNEAERGGGFQKK